MFVNKNDIIDLLSRAEFSTIDAIYGKGFDWYDSNNLVSLFCDSDEFQFSIDIFDNCVRYIVRQQKIHEKQREREIILADLVEEIMLNVLDLIVSSAVCTVDLHKLDVHKSMIHLLIVDYNYDINHKYSENGRHILSYLYEDVVDALLANERVSLDIIESLIHEGLNINALDENGHTFLDLLSVNWFRRDVGGDPSVESLKHIIETLKRDFDCNHGTFDHISLLLTEDMGYSFAMKEHFMRLYNMGLI